MRIIYVGTPEFSVAFLEALIAAGHIPVAVISQPDKPQGRKQTIEPTPVKRCAEAHTIPVLQPIDINTPEALEKIHALQPDLMVVVAFGQILKKEILALPRFGCINVHPSLLPKYRGAAPLQEAILHGDTETGVSIIQMDTKMDHGPILAQEKMTLSTDETLPSLRKKTTELGVKLLIQVIEKIQDGTIEPRPQDDALATYTRLLTRESGKIDWKKSASEVDCQIRALNPWPGTWTELNGTRLKILEAHSIELPLSHSEKTIFEHNSILIGQCGKGFLQLDSVQLEGKKVLSGADFARGYKNKLQQ